VPRIQSAKKALRKSKSAAARNKGQRSELRSAVKKVRAATTKAEAEKALIAASSILDRAGRKNLVHRRNAARMKSRLAAAVAARK
jgi:small subunit ribosomal protein S20